MNIPGCVRLLTRVQSALSAAHIRQRVQMQRLGHHSCSSSRVSTLTVASLATSSQNVQYNTALSAVVSNMSRLHTASNSILRQHSRCAVSPASLGHCKQVMSRSTSSRLGRRSAVAVATATADNNDRNLQPALPRKVTPLRLLTQQEIQQQRSAPGPIQQLQQQKPHSSSKLQQQPFAITSESQQQQMQQHHNKQQHLPVSWPFSSREPTQQEIFQHLKSVGSLLSNQQLYAVSAYLSELNEEQWEAVLCKAQHLRLIAGPGSGKTRTITARVAWCLANNTPPDQILVITFTRKAAGDLVERVKALLGGGVTRTLMPRTFHSFCNHLLRDHQHKSIVGEFVIATKDDAYNIVKGVVFPDGPPTKKDIKADSKGAKVKLQAVPSNVVRSGGRAAHTTGSNVVDLSKLGTSASSKDPVAAYHSAISRLKNFVQEIEGPSHNAAIHWCLCTRSGSELIQQTHSDGYNLFPPGLESQIAYVYDRYQEQMRVNNLLDFDDVLHRCLDLVKYDDEVRRALHSRYQHVFVDESQDTNLCQFELVKQITGQQANLFMVGDPDQAIYGFRGANSQLLSQVFLKHYPGTAYTRYLSRNYRSRPPIIQTADIIRGLHRGSSSPFKAAECAREHSSDHSVILLQADNQYKEAAHMIQQVQKWHGIGYVWGDMALLFRARDSAQFMYRMMVAANVPCIMPLGKDFWDSAEVKTAMTLLRCLVQPAAAGDVIKQRLIKKTGVSVPIMTGLGDTTIANLEKHLREHGNCGSSLGKCLLDSCFVSDITPADATAIVKRWLATTTVPSDSNSMEDSEQQAWEQLSKSRPQIVETAESDKVLEALGPAWQPLEGFTGVKTKNHRAAVARLRGLVVLGRAAAEVLPPAGVLKLMLVACGTWGSLRSAADNWDKDAQRRAANLEVLVDLADNTKAYSSADAVGGQYLVSMLSSSSVDDQTDSNSSSDGNGGTVARASPTSSRQQQTLQLEPVDSSSMSAGNPTTPQQQQQQQEQLVGMPALRLLYDFCVLQGEGDEDEDSKSQKVQLLTMHASKGKEFPCVGVMRVHEGMMPCIRMDDTTPNALEQERNTLYVSMTRAKDHLVVSWPAQLVYPSKFDDGYYVRDVLQPSEFIVPVLAAVKARRLPGVVFKKYSSDD